MNLRAAMLIVNVFCNTASLVTLLLSWWIPKTYHSSWNDINIASGVEVKTTSGLAAAILSLRAAMLIVNVACNIASWVTLLLS